MKRSHVLVVASLLVAASAALTGCPGHHHRFRVEVTPTPTAHPAMVAIANPGQLPAAVTPPVT